MAARGIALIIVGQLGGNVWPLNVEITSETNNLDVRNRSVMFFPEISDYPTLVEKELLFRAEVPKLWYVLRSKPPATKDGLEVWQPDIPIEEPKPVEILFHNVGSYKGAYGEYDVIIMEPTGVEVMYKNRNTVLGGRTLPQIAFDDLDLDLSQMLLDAWKRFQ